MFRNIVFALCLISCLACKPEHNQQNLDEFSHGQLSKWNQALTNVIIADIFSPPVASRIYAYANIAAYKALRPSQAQGYLTLAGQLNALDAMPTPEAGKTYYFPLSSIIAFSTVAHKLVFAKEKILEQETAYLTRIQKSGIDPEVFENSVAFGRLVGQAIIDWSSKDGYLERQALSRYVLSKEEGKWKPTPPDFMGAIEPNWRTIRPFVMDSASQFKPNAPTAYDSLPNSSFYQEALEVYEASKNLDEEQLAIAKFWDCNPNISYTKGHVMYYNQKISPGGHWLSIAAITAAGKGLDAMQTSETFALVSVALADGFISCWDEKFRSSLLRPETYIERYIDPNWDPILQTPAFPEYPSGHSVISSAAATVLTHLHGNTFAFADPSEVPYGLPIRNFKSFQEAAQEAAISRLYGGIHFRPAIVNGLSQGKQVGQQVIAKIKTREKKIQVKPATASASSL